MPRSKTTTDPRDLIISEMEAGGRKLSWLSEQTGIEYHHLYGCVKRKMIELSQDNLDKINRVLGTDFTLPE